MSRVRDPRVDSLDRALKQRTAEAAPELHERLDGQRVRCFACGHRCLVLEGLDGICRVRFNRDGALYVPRGYVASLQVDPIEKKPFFHAFPGADALSLGMLGCDYHCSYCQNWLTSQALRDDAAGGPVREASASELVELAVHHGAPVMVSTYNEPLITSEWAVEIFREARTRGISCGFVSNGNATPEVLRYLRPHIELYKVDLKSFRDPAYRKLGGRLDQVLQTVASLHELGVWLEIVTLLIPGFNDSAEELRELTGFIAGVSPDIPWHVTAFHKDYKMTAADDTTAADLLRAARIGQESGLHFVYAGNLPGRVGEFEDTRCPGCAKPLIRRSGYRILEYRLGPGGCCPDCSRPIAGFWQPDWAVPQAAGDGARRYPRSL